MILPGEDGTFGSIVAMAIQGHKLEVHLFGGEVLTETGTSFIVEVQILGLETVIFKDLVKFVVHCITIIFTSRFQWFN